LAAAPPAAAQFTVGQRPGEQTEQPDLRPPPVGELGGGDATIITYLAGIGLALAAWGLAILPSQRTHQD
jgi:hypothetical protein